AVPGTRTRLGARRHTVIDKEHPLVPKNPDGPLKVIVLGRLSKAKATDDQTKTTIESSMVVAKEYLQNVYKGPTQVHCLGEKISGMIADRATIRETQDLVDTGAIDLVLVEEMSRLSRNPSHMYSFVQGMVDRDTRFIAVADSLDTGDENWETLLGVSTLRH